MTRTIIILLTIVGRLAGQTQEQKDSLIIEICATISLHNLSSDSTVLSLINKNHIFPFLSHYSENQRKEIRTAIHFRAQHNCEPYKVITDRYNPQKGDWVILQERPSSTLNKELCNNILLHEKLYYKERNGDTVYIVLKNGFWTDNFRDGTYSKLKLEWIDDCEFEIEFLESNNASRKNFSKPGDKYRYKIIDREKTYYYMTVERIGLNKIRGFKIYY